MVGSLELASMYMYTYELQRARKRVGKREELKAAELKLYSCEQHKTLEKNESLRHCTATVAAEGRAQPNRRGRNHEVHACVVVCTQLYTNPKASGRVQNHILCNDCRGYDGGGTKINADP